MASIEELDVEVRAFYEDQGEKVGVTHSYAFSFNTLHIC
jgi:hypothetical protein